MPNADDLPNDLAAAPGAFASLGFGGTMGRYPPVVISE
jgi:hypothetical protein